jgi:hypothetical protein
MRAVAIAACVLVSMAAATSHAELIDRVLATVGPRVITLSDARAVSRLGLIDVARSPDATAEIVQRLIDRTLVLEEVDRYAPPEPSQAAIQAGVAAIRAHFRSPEEFARALAAAGIEERSVSEWVRNDLRIEQYITQRFSGLIEPTPADIEDYVAQHEREVDPDGRGAADAGVERAARERLVASRREALVREWIEGLRRRAEITVNPPATTP